MSFNDSRQFIIIPFRALENPELDGKHYKALCVLGGHTNKHGICKIRQSKVAEIMDVSRKTVNEYLGVLAEQNLIEKRPTKRADGGNGAMEYRMIYDTPPVPPERYTPCNPQGVTPPVTTAVTAITTLTEYSNEVKDIPKGISKKTVVRLVKEAWNSMAEQHGLSTVKTNLLTPSRDRVIAERLKDCGGDELLIFEAIANVARNPFWIGKGDKIWKADFDWVFKASKFSTVLEYQPTPESKTNDSKANKSSYLDALKDIHAEDTDAQWQGGSDEQQRPSAGYIGG